MRQFKATISSNKKIADDHYVLSFKAGRIAKETEPGQFFNVRVSNNYQPLLRRPFGAHKIRKDKIELLYKVVGKATELLKAKKKGETLDILGPLGNGFNVKLPRGPKPSAAVLVAGGHGVAPLVALAEKLKMHGLKLTLFIGARAKKHLVCVEDFKSLGAKVYIATDDGSKGYNGLITDLLKKKAQGAQPIAHSAIYACGPKPMLKEVAKFTKTHKIECQVSLEEYIACGIGTCLGCAVKTTMGFKLVCKDGPVFDAREIVWQ